MFRKIVSFVMALSIGVCAVGSASADVSSNMNGYWSNSLGAVSVTGPTAYQGQQGGYYSLGNIAVRTPQETTQVAAISMPQISGGCGGIDLYSGAMSFIGADQLISTIKGIASNAAPYAFMLALSLISSPISDQLKTFQAWLADKTDFSISSCEKAQEYVDKGAKALIGQDQFCQRLGRAKGTFSDAVAARNGCGSKSLAANATASAADLKWSPINRNIAWEAIMGNSLLSSDLQMAQLMQTMTGSYIIRCPNDATGVQSCVQTILPAEAAKDSVLTVILDGGTLKVHKCDTTTACLNPVKDGLTVTISTAPTCTSDASSCSLKAKVSLMLTSIVEKIRSRTPLTDPEIRFVNMTSIPVLKMASVYASQQGVGSDVVLQQYSDVIAIDIAYGWLMNNIRKVEEGANALTGINQDQLTEWRSATAGVRQELLDRQTLVQSKVVAITDIVQRTQAAEQALNAQVKTRLGESLRFSQSLSQ
jgi:conjugative transfer pilus assembly protein TraH